MPRVSVLSPTYNHAKYVTEAVQSVLTQTFEDFELIVTDDASTDNTVEKIQQFKDPRLTLLRNDQNQGTSSASKKGWLQSSGEYVSWLTTDDVYEPNLLQTFVNYLDNHPQDIGVFGLAHYIDDNSKFLDEDWTDVGVGQDRFTHLRQLFKLKHPFCSPAGMIRRTALEKLGYFPPCLRQTDDMAQYIKLLFYGQMPILPDRVLRYRWRANDGNRSSRTIENDYRLDFELFEILDFYRESLNSVDLLRKVFPEVDQHPWPLDEDLISFHLAHVAISFGYPSHRLYGLHVLYQLLKDEDYAKSLKERCNFSYTDFFHLAGRKAVITNYALYVQNTELANKNETLSQELRTAKLALADCLSRLALVPNSIIKLCSKTRRVASSVKKRLRSYLY